ncbi:Rsa1p Ecym_2220 [Eremothecium cymbalariae DBVPG|uniref:FMR1-interacting protein 1 conserved domain-containing protein n=1 Tax=Eremothecium cymbalariae (strain CBS 270.75 / DBVPG 7215 / KCTC 17166 / NRRL Y-17582) TaxID=931890 RepID=G8JP64_ERECY|nr:Hypothetical protein Ecym_2220 [Eremothecium cymbalariae DBVPG\
MSHSPYSYGDASKKSLNLPKPTFTGTLDGQPTKRYKTGNHSHHEPPPYTQQPLPYGLSYGGYISTSNYGCLPQVHEYGGQWPQYHQGQQYYTSYYQVPQQPLPYIQTCNNPSVPFSGYNESMGANFDGAVGQPTRQQDFRINTERNQQHNPTSLIPSVVENLHEKSEFESELEDVEEGESKDLESFSDSSDEAKSGETVANKSNTTAITIPGTSIQLGTAEEIEKWRQERRKMWLLKISNNKEKHKKVLGIRDEEIKEGPLVQAKKEKKFIQSIQSQISRSNCRPNLAIGLVQRSMIDENAKLLAFIKELGDANYFNYVLTENEKESLFGRPNRNNHSRADGATNKRSNYQRSFNPYRAPTRTPKN